MNSITERIEKLNSGFIIGRLVNWTNTSEGPVLPPRVVGHVRVPLVTNLRTARVENLTTATRITLTWDDVPGAAHYNVYVYGSQPVANQGVGPYATPASPCQFTLATPDVTRVWFLVQTVLRSGMVSDLEYSPSCTAVTFAT